MNFNFEYHVVVEIIALATNEATAWASQLKAAEGSPKDRRRYKLFFMSSRMLGLLLIIGPFHSGPRFEERRRLRLL